MDFRIAAPQFVTMRDMVRKHFSMYEKGAITMLELESRVTDMILGSEKSMVSLIVAYDEGRVIGDNGQVPWRISEDMKHFKDATMGCPVIMGRKTWDSLPDKFKPLPGRTNFVLTRTPSKSHFERTFFMNSMETAIDLARHSDPGKTLWVIGGSEIYKAALDGGWVDRIVASEVKGRHGGDAFFPEISEQDWERVPVSSHDLFNVAWYVRRT